MSKFIMAFSILIVSLSTLAQETEKEPVLKCSTDGFGLASMTVEHSKSEVGIIKINFSEDSDETPTIFQIKSGFLDLQTDTSATLVAQKDGKEPEGGAYEDAALLRVVSGKKRAFLAVHGSVYLLRCY